VIPDSKARTLAAGRLFGALPTRYDSGNSRAWT
jgi:hypothetical protein